MNRPVRPIHFGMLSIVFFFNITMSVAGFFKELHWLLNQHTDFETELASRIDEMHEDLEQMMKEE